MVFKNIRGLWSATAATCVVGAWGRLAKQDHPAYIPRPSFPTRRTRLRRPGVDSGARIAVQNGRDGGVLLFQCLGERIVSHEPAVPPAWSLDQAVIRPRSRYLPVLAGAVLTGRSWTRRTRGACLSARQIRSTGHTVQDRPWWSVRWVDIPQLSIRVRHCLPSWQRYWQQPAETWTAEDPNRICSSGCGCSDWFTLDRRRWPVLREPRRPVVNCNPNCNPPG
jgi:hypothetical protein